MQNRVELLRSSQYDEFSFLSSHVQLYRTFTRTCCKGKDFFFFSHIWNYSVLLIKMHATHCTWIG